MNKAFYQQLAAFVPWNAQEEQDKKVLLQYIEKFDDIFYRENVFAHMTSSPWIVNPAHDKVLMVYHNIFRSWSWCGGHCDGDEDCAGVALREGKEETGVTKLKLLYPDILAIDILPVPPHWKHGKFVSAHVHLNIAYACEADDRQALHRKPDENSGVRWIAVDSLDQWVNEADMLPVYHKLIEKTRVLVSAKK